MPVSNQDADQLLSDESDSPLALAIQASLDDIEVNFGPICDEDGDNQDSTLPWHPHDFNSMQVQCRTESFLKVLQKILLPLLILLRSFPYSLFCR